MIEAGIKNDSQVFNLPTRKVKSMRERVHLGRKDDELGLDWLEEHKIEVLHWIV